MNNRFFGAIGILATVIFLSTYIIMSSMRPEYSIYTKAISELGSVNAPHKWLWNIFGYILPGILIAVFAIGLYKNIVKVKSSKLPLYGILLSGVFMGISGIFPGDFENKTSTTMLLHTIGSFGSYVFFLIGAFSYPYVMKSRNDWKSVIKPTLLCTYATIIFGTWSFIFPSIPAFGQRIVFLFYFVWILYMAVNLYKQPKDSFDIN